MLFWRLDFFFKIGKKAPKCHCGMGSNFGPWEHKKKIPDLWRFQNVMLVWVYDLGASLLEPLSSWNENKIVYNLQYNQNYCSKSDKNVPLNTEILSPELAPMLSENFHVHLLWLIMKFVLARLSSKNYGQKWHDWLFWARKWPHLFVF